MTLLNRRLEADRRQILGRGFLGGIQTLYHISLELILNLVQTPSLVDQLLELRFVLAVGQQDRLQSPSHRCIFDLGSRLWR